jgi:hypothetical protein
METRERIQRAFRSEWTDRIPRYEIFFEDFKTCYRKAHGLPDGIDVYDRFPRVDIGTVLADQRGPLYASEKVLEDDGDAFVIRDSWGRRLYQRRSAYFERVQEVVLSDKHLLDDLVFDDPHSDAKYQGFEQMAERAGRRFAPVCGVLGLFMGSYRMRGEMEYLLDLAEDPEFCQELAGRLASFITDAGLEVARRTGCLDTAIWVYDEFSSTQGPLFSPALFERIFHPLYKRMFASWRAAGMENIVLHCDGNCMPLLDMLIDAGFNGLQGVAPSTGMWLPDIKKRYGRRLVLIGGMDNIDTLVHGTREDIERQTAALVEAAQDGGVILGTHSIDADVSPENYDIYASYLDDHDSMPVGDAIGGSSDVPS